MMNKRKIIIILICLLILDSAIILFINFYKQSENDKIDVVKFDKEYKLLKDFSKSFVSKRDALYENELNGVIIAEVKENNEKYQSKLKEIEIIIDEVKIKTKYLKEICFKKESATFDVAPKCITYKSTYEKMNNYFVEDINNFNVEIIKKYNEKYNETLPNYVSSSYTKYIDYNNDKKIEGKKE